MRKRKIKLSRKSKRQIIKYLQSRRNSLLVEIALTPLGIEYKNYLKNCICNFDELLLDIEFYCCK